MRVTVIFRRCVGLEPFEIGKLVQTIFIQVQKGEKYSMLTLCVAHWHAASECHSRNSHILQSLDAKIFPVSYKTIFCKKMRPRFSQK